MASGMRRLGPLLVVALTCAAPPPAAAQMGGSPHFSRLEKLQLRRGKLVTRPTEEQRGPMRLVGGMSWQVVDVPVEVVEKVLDDLSAYKHLLPGVSKLRQIHGNTFKTLHICHAKGAVEGCYYANVRFANGGHDVFFQLDQTHRNDIEAGWGFLRITKYGKDHTLVAWGVMADVGKGILAGFMRPKVREWMLKVPSVMKKYLEHRYRDT